MAGSLEHPLYRCLIKTKKASYDVSNLLTSLTTSQNDEELAQSVSITIPNIKDKYKYLYNNITVRDSLYLYCDAGTGFKEIFRGIIWEKDYTSDVTKDLSFTAYDRLIYLQNSQDNFFFPKGKNTKTILQTICKRWGIKLNFQYKSIKHKRKIIREEYISDAILTILEEVKKKTGIKYVIYCEKGVLTIRKRAYNKKIYTLNQKDSALSQNTRVTMDGMVTKVAIYREQESEKKELPPKKVTVVKGNTSRYGTLQEIIVRDSDDKKSAHAKKEAKEILKEHGKPTYERTLEAVDNPYIKKGHRIKSGAGALIGYYTVIGIEHDCFNGTMNLEVET
ncbi:XkdQ/YqbQ family protein [Anaerostipes sp.]|uniref:XkdQ/YqbQ family protein n=1 Tax=Anaerostipes sp. TaxID=1872530 RepID=UPI0025B818B6|nr:hypothetical protein [Anaerostipes sp.]MBS7007052.1 hypothetical protein [Anaerostipes sp.]